MRIFVAGLFHESNVFSPIATQLSSFVAWGDEQREPIPPLGAGNLIMGYGDLLNAVAEAGLTPIQGPYFEAHPSAPVDSASFEILIEKITTSLQKALEDKASGSVDAILLYLHGAQTAMGETDCEGALLSRLRQIAGTTYLPTGVMLDLHGNTTERMLRGADILVACREYPHIDYASRARHLCALIQRTVKKEIQPRMVLWQLPVSAMLPTNGTDGQQLLARMDLVEQQSGVLSLSIFHGFAWSDHEDACASILLVLDVFGSIKLESEWTLVEGITQQFTRACDSFAIANPLMSSDLALTQAREALREYGFPVVLADRGDNAGAGGASDSTWLLHSVVQSQRQQAWPGTVAVALIYDPEAVAQAHALGQDAEGDFSIGGHHAGSGSPFQGRMRVRACRKDAGQQLFGGELRVSLGDTALLEIDGVVIVVNTERQQVMSPHVFSEHGLDPAQCALLIVKSTNHFRGGFEALASAIILSDPPGPTTEDLTSYAWQGLTRPIWPLDDLSIQQRAIPRNTLSS